MKTIRLFFSCILLLFIATCGFAQEGNEPNTLTYRVEAFGSAASGSNTPFWMTSNRYGVVPLNAGNGYLRPGVFYNGMSNKGFHWRAGLDMAVVAPRYRNVYIQQVYAEIGYQALLLSIGSKERYTSLWDRRLSSGDMVLSPNARPIPEINLSFPEFTIVPYTKGWLQVKGDFAAGRSFDNAYLKQFVNEKQLYNKNIRWHHKSIYFRIKDTQNHFPLSFNAGLQHWAQWGGTTSGSSIAQPHSLKDFIRIVCAKEGGGDATISDQINVLGNHYGSYDFKLSFIKENWASHAYHQRYFEDKSGIEFHNGPDGLWGIQVDLTSFPWIRTIVVEHLETRHQTGSFHFISFDHDKHPGIGGGADNYYNNGEYRTGASYFNRGLGSPLLPSPEYNTDGSLGFKNNRVSAWHIGLEGCITSQIDYRILLTNMNSWGTHSRPFLDTKGSTSGLLEVSYWHPKLSGWLFTGSLAADRGAVYTKSIGFGLSASKRGVFKIRK
ncbi:MAG: capsule assembly Wzi family protein [Tannerellaceae bacterium]|jgi:hypothetical protein|nr:capsule assembly Wzi family protein [Tannerellaceae bacterium]